MSDVGLILQSRDSLVSWTRSLAPGGAWGAWQALARVPISPPNTRLWLTRRSVWPVRAHYHLVSNAKPDWQTGHWQTREPLGILRFVRERPSLRKRHRLAAANHKGDLHGQARPPDKAPRHPGIQALEVLRLLDHCGTHQGIVAFDEGPCRRCSSKGDTLSS
jgi:hypothetical protein